MKTTLSHYAPESNHYLEFMFRTVYMCNENSVLHYHDFFEIFLVLSNDVVHVINGYQESISRGTLVFIRKQDTHCFKYTSSNEPSFVNLIFTEDLMKKLCNYLLDENLYQELITSRQPPSVFLDESDITWFLKQMELLNSTPNDDFSKLKYQTKVFLFKLFTRYFYKALSHTNSPKDNIPDWLYQLNKEMQKYENFSQHSNHMVEMSGKNREYLGRVLKQHYGKTLSQYINDLRLNYWANVLVTSDAPILDICYDCGFQNVSWAYQLFKEKYGMSPLQYRKQNT